MLVDLIDKLIDRIIQLAQWEKESRKNLFNDFIDPIFAEFEVVHKEYLDSFRRYRTLIRSSSVSLNSVCDTIEEDNLFTEDRRARLKEFANAGSNTSTIRPFINSIIQYLTDPYDLVWELMSERKQLSNLEPDTSTGKISIGEPQISIGEPQISIGENIHQVYREPLLHSIRAKKVKTKNEAIKVLDTIVLKLQERYSKVVSEYAKLKKSLLT